MQVVKTSQKSGLRTSRIGLVASRHHGRMRAQRSIHGRRPPEPMQDEQAYEVTALHLVRKRRAMPEYCGCSASGTTAGWVQCRWTTSASVWCCST